jgi:hypothetical protein
VQPELSDFVQGAAFTDQRQRSDDRAGLPQPTVELEDVRLVEVDEVGNDEYRAVHARGNGELLTTAPI